MRRTSSRCQRRSVCGVTIKPRRRGCGRIRVSAARKARSAGRSDGPLLPSEHDELVSQHEQLDVLNELAAAVPDQEPQHSGEGEIGKRKEHQAMMPSLAIEGSDGTTSVLRLQLTSCEAQRDLVLARA